MLIIENDSKTEQQSTQANSKENQEGQTRSILSALFISRVQSFQLPPLSHSKPLGIRWVRQVIDYGSMRLCATSVLKFLLEVYASVEGQRAIRVNVNVLCFVVGGRIREANIAGL